MRAPNPNHWTAREFPSVTYVLRKSLRPGCFLSLNHRGCVATGMCYRAIVMIWEREVETGKEGDSSAKQISPLPLLPPASPAQLSPLSVPVLGCLGCATPASSCCSPTQACRPHSAEVLQALPPSLARSGRITSRLAS